LRHWYSTAIPPVDEKNQSVSFMGNPMKQNLTLLQSGVNTRRRSTLDGVESSRWAALQGWNKKARLMPRSFFEK
jgi:hypothetical protein